MRKQFVTKQICKGDNCVQVSGDIYIGNGTKIQNSRIGSSSQITSSSIILNGKEIPAPPKVRGNNRSVEIINNHVWFGGYYWTGNEWVKMSKLRFRLMRKN